MKKGKEGQTSSDDDKYAKYSREKEEKITPIRYVPPVMPNNAVDSIYFVNYRAVVVKTKHYYVTQNSYMLFGDVFKIYNLKGEIKKIHAFFPGDENNLSDTLIMLKTTIVAVTTSKGEALRVADEIEMTCKICHKKRKATKFSIEGFLRKVRCDTCRVKPRNVMNKNNSVKKGNNFKSEVTSDSATTKKMCLSCDASCSNGVYTSGGGTTALSSCNNGVCVTSGENRHSTSGNCVGVSGNCMGESNNIVHEANINKQQRMCSYNSKCATTSSLLKGGCYQDSGDLCSGSGSGSCSGSASSATSGSAPTTTHGAVQEVRNRDEIIAMIIELIKYISWMQKALAKASKGNCTIENTEVSTEKISKVVHSAQLLCNKLLRQKSIVEQSSSNFNLSSFIPTYNSTNNNTANNNFRVKYSNLYEAKINSINRQNETNINLSNSSVNMFNSIIGQNGMAISGGPASSASGASGVSGNSGATAGGSTGSIGSRSIGSSSIGSGSIGSGSIGSGSIGSGSIGSSSIGSGSIGSGSIGSGGAGLDVDSMNNFNNISCSIIPYYANACQLNCVPSSGSSRNDNRMNHIIKSENNYMYRNNKNEDFAHISTQKNSYYNDKQDIVFSALSKQYNSNVNISFSNINNSVSNFYRTVSKNYNLRDTILHFEK
ncbi:conserved Plasmodium protein, unknown function [Plasmodium ovale]|uniref:Uncharacterized protein n=1 Tax=Plasmodium ovale TaxID=36330 RepID=A0A1D3UB51_PLAOA|nr:conserved Plasmodium protein, unknown function [Plasmodium ovale]